MVDAVPALLVLAPLEEREVDDEAAGGDLRVGEVQARGHLAPQGVEGGAGDLRLVGDEDEEVAALGAGALRHALYQLHAQVAVHRRANVFRRQVVDAAFAEEGDGYEPLAALVFDELRQAVDLAAGEGSAAGRREAAYLPAGRDDVAEDGEVAGRAEVGDVDELHAEAQVGLVGAVATHRPRRR